MKDQHNDDNLLLYLYSIVWNIFGNKWTSESLKSYRLLILRKADWVAAVVVSLQESSLGFPLRHHSALNDAKLLFLAQQYWVASSKDEGMLLINQCYAQTPATSSCMMHNFLGPQTMQMLPTLFYLQSTRHLHVIVCFPLPAFGMREVCLMLLKIERQK